MDKIQELKQLVGEDVAKEILSASDKLTTRAKRLGLKYKENGMAQNDFAEFVAAYQAFKAFNAGEGEVAELDETEEETVEIVEKEVATKMDTSAIENAVMKAVKAAFGEMRGGSEEEDDKAKAKELDAVKAANAQLVQTVKELADRVALLEQPVAPQLNGGYRLTDNPQETAKMLSGAAHNGTLDVLDALGGLN